VICIELTSQAFYSEAGLARTDRHRREIGPAAILSVTPRRASALATMVSLGQIPYHMS
jgi:hypothetical protein